MPIKSSPAPLAISEIVTEFGDAAGGSDSMSEYYRGGANVDDVSSNNNIPTSGAIDIGDFYGTGNAVSVAASAGTNVDVAPLFASPDTFTNAVSKILTPILYGTILSFFPCITKIGEFISFILSSELYLISSNSFP